MRILLVEDSERLQRSVGTALRRAGYAVDVTGDGEEGLWYATSHEYDVIVLDLMLPRLDGLSLLARLREGGRDTHVLVLTAKDTVEDRVTGLRRRGGRLPGEAVRAGRAAGADRGAGPPPARAQDPSLRFGDLVIDTARRDVTHAGARVELSPREYALLHYLAPAPRRGRHAFADRGGDLRRAGRADEQRGGRRRLRTTEEDRPPRPTVRHPDAPRDGLRLPARTRPGRPDTRGDRRRSRRGRTRAAAVPGEGPRRTT